MIFWLDIDGVVLDMIYSIYKNPEAPVVKVPRGSTAAGTFFLSGAGAKGRRDNMSKTGKADILEMLGLREDREFIVTSKSDFDGNGITIVVQGNQGQDKTDLTVSAAKLLVENAFSQTRDDINDDRMGDYQSLIPILDHIGALIRSNLPYKYAGINLELAKEYIDWFMRDDLHKSPQFQDILDQKDED